MVDDYYEPTLSDHVRALRRLWPLLVVPVFVGAILGFLVASGSGDPDYTSDSVVSVVDERFVVTSLDLQIAEISTPSATAAMNRALADDVGAVAAERAGESIDVVGVADESAGTFTLTVTAADPQTAVDQAAIYGEAALEVAATSRGEVLGQTAAALTRRIEELDVELAALRARLAGAEPSEVDSLNSEIEMAAQRRLEFGDRMAALESFQSTTTGGLRQLAPASDAEESGGGPSTAVLVVGGALFGALVGMGLVIVANLADRKIRSRIDVELNAPGLPVVGVLGRNDVMQDSPAAQALARRAEGSVESVVLIPAGSHPVDPQLATETAKALEQFGPPMGVSIGAAETLAFDDPSQGVVVVAEAGVTTDDDLACRATELDDMGVNTLGLLLCGVDARDLPRAAAGLGSRRGDDNVS